MQLIILLKCCNYHNMILLHSAHVFKNAFEWSIFSNLFLKTYYAIHLTSLLKWIEIRIQLWITANYQMVSYEPHFCPSICWIVNLSLISFIFTNYSKKSLNKSLNFIIRFLIHSAVSILILTCLKMFKIAARWQAALDEGRIFCSLFIFGIFL